MHIFLSRVRSAIHLRIAVHTRSLYFKNERVTTVLFVGLEIFTIGCTYLGTTCCCVNLLQRWDLTCQAHTVFEVGCDRIVLKVPEHRPTLRGLA